jgi:hypothetical protein
MRCAGSPISESLFRGRVLPGWQPADHRLAQGRFANPPAIHGGLRPYTVACSRPDRVERVPHLLLDTEHGSGTDVKASPKGADYHAQANGLGARTHSRLAASPERAK